LELKGVDIGIYQPGLFTLLHEDVAVHLFRVASGLDSLILGEGQILAQVKEALSSAQKLKSTGIVIDKLFKSALSVGKRVRTETGIASRDASVSQAALDFAKKLDPNLLDRKISLIGGGKMIEILLSAFKEKMTPEQQQGVRLVNRSENRLTSLVEKYGFPGYTWPQLPAVLEDSEVLFVATGAPHAVLFPDDFQVGCEKLIMDISVPRNVDPMVGELSGVRLYNTDDLVGVSGFSPESEHLLKDQAQSIIEEEFSAFHHWFKTLPVAGPTIARLRAKVESIRKEEAACHCPVLGSSCNIIDELSKSLINKILHDPTVRLKSTRNLNEIYQQAAALSRLFNLQGPDFEPFDEGDGLDDEENTGLELASLS
jgi:glutamyl-tRNA reductase